MTHIFISYSRRDWAIAEGLAENLDVLGYRVWIDAGIKPNVPFTPAISSALEQAHVVIVVWSASSIASEWVRWEAGEALKASKLLQLRVQDIPVDQIPEPFRNYTIYAEGGPEELKLRIEALIASASTVTMPQFSNPRPVRPPSETQEARSLPQRANFVLSIAALAVGLVIYPLQPQLGSLIAAGALIAGTALTSYSAYFSVSRFADRFGRRLVIESLTVGLVAGVFAGIAGGYLYARGAPDTTPGIDLFSVRYIRVIVISGIVGTALSYLVMAMLRYLRLRERNLGPAWSRRNVSMQIAVPAVLAIALTLGTTLLADNLPRVGKAIEFVTLGHIDWIGSGRCTSVKVCVSEPKGFCASCTVGNMTKVDITLVLAIYLWTLHVYHLRQAGGRLARILVSSGVLTSAVLAVMFAFQLYPQTVGQEIASWRIVIFIVPWVLLIFATVVVIYGNARAIENAAILDSDRS
jgi:hypothetical protein